MPSPRRVPLSQPPSHAVGADAHIRPLSATSILLQAVMETCAAAQRTGRRGRRPLQSLPKTAQHSRIPSSLPSPRTVLSYCFNIRNSRRDEGIAPYEQDCNRTLVGGGVLDAPPPRITPRTCLRVPYTNIPTCIFPENAPQMRGRKI